MQRLGRAILAASALLVASLGLPAPAAVADDELNVSSSTNGVVLNDPDKNFDNVKVELRSFGNEFRYVIHQRASPGGLDAGTGCRGETKEAGDQATISCVRLFPKVTANLGNRTLSRAATNRFEVPPTFPDPISYQGGGDTEDTVIGGLNADTIVAAFLPEPGKTAADNVQGMGGDDDIQTAGSPAGSVADGGEGNDTLHGGPVLRGGPGNDILHLSSDTGGSALGEDGNDSLAGSGQADVLVGGDGDDQLDAGNGDDLLQPGKGSDLDIGGPGADRIEMAGPSDANGFDTVVLEGADVLDYHLVNAPLQIVGAPGPNPAQGFARSPNQTVGDVLKGQATRIIGGSDNDVITDGAQTGPAPHRFQGGPGNDTINAGDGPDELFGGPGIDDLKAGAGDDLIDSVDGIKDAITCGPGLDFASLDLVDPDTSFTFGGKTPKVADVCEATERANRKEGPNVALLTQSARVGGDGSFGVKLRCPKDAHAKCSGRLTARLAHGGASAPRATRYAIRRGRSKVLRVRLTKAESRRASGETALVRSVEKGRFGDKTTIRLIALRR